MPTSLRGIADKAQADKQHRFGNLYELLNEEFLKECWREINRDAAYGVDRVSARDYEEHLEANLRDLVERLKRKTYQAKLVRRHYIPKGEGKLRPLGIPIVRSYCTSIQWALGLLFQVSRLTTGQKLDNHPPANKIEVLKVGH